MKIKSITIRPTAELLKLDGVEVRLWQGTTDQGQDCLVFVHRVAIEREADQTAIVETLGPELEPPTSTEFVVPAAFVIPDV